MSRLHALTLAAAVLGTAIAWVGWSPEHAAAFAAGACLSTLNLLGWERIVNAISRGEKPRRLSLVFVATRYVVLGIAAYVIISVFNLSAAAVLTGCLAAAVAVTADAVLEVFHART
jgi:hypothetical protein